MPTARKASTTVHVSSSCRLSVLMIILALRPLLLSETSDEGGDVGDDADADADDETEGSDAQDGGACVCDGKVERVPSPSCR